MAQKIYQINGYRFVENQKFVTVYNPSGESQKFSKEDADSLYQMQLSLKAEKKKNKEKSKKKEKSIKLEKSVERKRVEKEPLSKNERVQS